MTTSTVTGLTNPVKLWRMAKKKSKRGGKRKGAGRKTMFDGPRSPLAVKVTEDCHDLINVTRAKLEPEHGTAATVGSAVEYLIRKGFNRAFGKSMNRPEPT